MKSPPETGPPNPEEGKQEEDQAEKILSMKSQVQNESEKDSGYSDSSSESLSAEETNGSTSVMAAGSAQGSSSVQTTYTPIYILQNVVMKPPRLLLLQAPVRRHRKRPSPSSYLPILRSYPKIAPRLAPPPTVSSTPSPAPPSATPPINRPAASLLLEVSLRSLALMRRSRESQRSIRDLRAHARLYEQALQGEEGGWERLQKAMEQSGGYRRIASSASDMVAEASPMAVTLPEAAMTSSGDTDTHSEETMISQDKSMTSSVSQTTGSRERNV